MYVWKTCFIHLVHTSMRFMNRRMKEWPISMKSGIPLFSFALLNSPFRATKSSLAIHTYIALIFYLKPHTAYVCFLSISTLKHIQLNFLNWRGHISSLSVCSIRCEKHRGRGNKSYLKKQTKQTIRSSGDLQIEGSDANPTAVRQSGSCLWVCERKKALIISHNMSHVHPPLTTTESFVSIIHWIACSISLSSRSIFCVGWFIIRDREREDWRRTWMS